MSRVFIIITMVATLLCPDDVSASPPAAEHYVAAFYNVENLFDTVNHLSFDDGDFTPRGAMKWNSAKYFHKINNISKVISNIGGSPDIIGLCEIENGGVLEDLVNAPSLAGMGYEWVHFESRDRRGIDVALLYKSARVEPVMTTRLRYRNAAYSSRDILHFGCTLGEDTVHILVCHLPSVTSSKRQRIAAAESVGYYADSIHNANPNGNVIIMGDLNCNPGAGIYDIVAGKNARGFFSPFEKLFAAGYGSYKYRGAWNMYDNIIMSHSLATGGGLHYEEGSAHIFITDKLIRQEGRFSGYPFRSFAGNSFTEGYSDHLPVYITLKR